jgi:ATP-dependent Lhr-like helicase
VLIQAPTGSGKTLAAFLSGIDRLNESPGEGLRLLYISPLKALNYDVERNLRGRRGGERALEPGSRLLGEVSERVHGNQRSPRRVALDKVCLDRLIGDERPPPRAGRNAERSRRASVTES